MANPLPGNEFADVAHFAAEKVTSGWSNEADAAVATAFATLAIAYEQRTATLVHALLSDSLVTDGQYEYLQTVVRARLGLDEVQA